MPQSGPTGPDLTGVIADAERAELPYVVIGGFSVIFHGARPCHQGFRSPLDFETVAERADWVDWHGKKIRIASLPSVVGFKRLAGRDRDREDLHELEKLYGDLPVEPVPGLDS